jgi:hypothetical protein
VRSACEDRNETKPGEQGRVQMKVGGDGISKSGAYEEQWCDFTSLEARAQRKGG